MAVARAVWHDSRMDKHSPAGRISTHGEGAGAFSPDDVERRARELALIEGRSKPRQEDRDQALRELRGTDLPPLSDSDGASAGGISRDPRQPPSHYGHQEPDREDADGQQAVERLVVEGVEEAQHDQMVQAGKRRAKEDEAGDGLGRHRS